MIILISGGSAGIGRATAIRYAEAGHKVYELSRTDREVPGVIHLTGDVCRMEDVKRAVRRVEEEEGRVDVLISNAGYGISGSFEETSEEDFIRQFDVNVFGTIRLIQQVLPLMRKQGQGRILITSSLAAEAAVPFQSFYSATKAALNSFCLSLNNEVRPFGISVCALMPGDLATRFTDCRVKTGSSVYTRLNESVTRMEEDERGGASPDKAARKLYRLGTQKRVPRPLQSLGFRHSAISILIRILPHRFTNWLIGKVYA